MTQNTAEQFRSLSQGQIVKVTTKTIGRKVRSITRYGEVTSIHDLGSIVLISFRQQVQRDYGFCSTSREFTVTSGSRVLTVEVVG